jgi:hypothetical protein
MIVTIFFPEGLVVFALGQFRGARMLCRACRERVPLVKIDMEEAFFVLMGGFIVDVSTVQQPTVSSDVPAGKTTTVSSDVPAKQQTTISSEPLEPELLTLTAGGFIHYLEQANSPLIEEKGGSKKLRHSGSISDKGKASNIAKVLAFSQAAWLLAQCIARGAAGLPLTLLEIHLATQVVCTLIAYAFWYHKPLDVMEPIKLELEDPCPVSSEMKSLCYTTTMCSDYYGSIFSKACYDIVSQLHLPDLDLGSSSNKGWVSKYLLMILEGILIMVAGGIHAAAWDVHFPTPIESWLWRISSIELIVFPLSLGIIGQNSRYDLVLINATRKRQYLCGFRMLIPWAWEEMILGANEKADKSSTKRDELINSKARIHFCLMWFCLFFVALYGFFIVFLLVESYISLRSPPARAFETPEWNNNWPHL